MVRRQSAEDDQPDVIPPDETLSADLPGGLFTDTAQVPASAMQTIPSTILFASTTINGQPTTVSVGVPTGAPVSTEVVPDPTLADSELSIAETFAIATDLSTTSLDEDMTTWTPMGTVAVDTALATTPAMTTSASNTQATASATPSATAGTTSSSGERVACGWWATAMFAVLVSFWLV
jgi:hypothetical protein